MDKKALTKEVHLEHAGTLKDFISEYEKQYLTALKITGEVNASDFNDVLDDMCHTWSEYEDDDDDDENFIIDYDETPKLRILDMRDCTFVGGNSLPDFGYRCILTEFYPPKGIVSFCEDASLFHPDYEYVEKTILPEGLKELNGVFSCSKISELTLPETLEVLGEWALEDCDNLTEIFIPKNVRQIHGGAFAGCSIREFKIDERNPYFVVVDGVIFTKDLKTLVAFPSNYPSPKFTVPDTVTTINDGAFSESKIESVQLPGSLEKIDDQAFAFSQIKKIIIPESVKEIGQLCFRFCKNLEYIKSPAKLKTLGKQFVTGCDKLKSIEIPPTIKEIKCYDLVWTPSLEHIKLNDGLEIISGGYEKVREGSLKEIVFPKTLKSVPGGIFRKCFNLKMFQIDPENPYLCVYEGALYSKDMKKLFAVPDGSRKGFHCPEGVEALNDGLFLEFENLETIELPHSLQVIEGRTFDGCSSLKELTLYENVKKIHFRAFDGCKSLKSLTVYAENPPEIFDTNKSGFVIFGDCKSLTLYVPKNSIDKYREADYWKNIKKIKEI